MKPTSLIAALCLAPALAHAGLQYEVGSLGSGRIYQATVTGLNNHGAVTGTYMQAPGQPVTPFIAHDGVLSALPLSFTPTAINDHGVLGGVATRHGVTGAALYANGQITHLGDLGHQSMGHASRVYALNNAGQAVGTANLPTGGIAATLFSGGAVTNIGSLYGGNTWARDINESGVIVGSTDPGTGWGRAYIYANGAMTDLGTMGGLFSSALAVNNHGDVVGYGDTGGDPWDNYHAFLYSGGRMHDLGIPAGAERSSAHDISSNGTVIGYWGAGASATPFIYTGGVMHSASSLMANPGWSVKEIYAINDNDQIAAQVCLGAGDCYLGLLSPVPEPATWGMLLGGLGVLGMAARRRRAHPGLPTLP